MHKCLWKKAISLLLTVLFAFNVLLCVAGEQGISAQGSLELNVNDCIFSKGIQKIESEMKDGESAIEVQAGVKANFVMMVDDAGVYTVSLTYYNDGDDSSALSVKMDLDGEELFSEIPEISFSKPWEDTQKEKIYDSNSNQVRPKQNTAKKWFCEYAFDPTGRRSLPLEVFLTAGKHTLTITPVSEKLILTKIDFIKKTEIPTYQTISENRKKQNLSNGKDCILLEAEDNLFRSDRSMQAISDKTSPTVTPYSATKSLYNTVGGTQWKLAGQWIEWRFDIASEGLYQIGCHFKQSEKTGDISVRELYIDGELPFADAAAIEFPYDNAWQFQYISDQESQPYLFYLTKGSHTIRLKVGLGKIAESIVKAGDILTMLNSVYRRIVVITGSSPDIYRDYQLGALIPDVFSDMETLKKQIVSLKEEVSANSGGSHNSTAIDRLLLQLEQMIKDDDKVPVLLSSFQENISAFGTWINGRTEQPLTLDSLVICPPQREEMISKAGFFTLFKHYFVQFLSSFVTDYNAVGVMDTKSDKSIKVWLAQGRDQSLILKSLINDDFTPQSGIAVNLQLVAAAALLPSIVAGTAPDVYMGMSESEPVNLALRGALVDLSKFHDFQEICQRFYPGATVPFQFNGGTYALPDTMSFYMMFYRKDIMSELGIDLEWLNTWDSVLKRVLPELQVNSLWFGVPTGLNSFAAQLYQNGGSIYQDDGKKSALSSSEALDCMESYSKLYTQYGLPLSYDFANRFRSGEMPVAVVDYLQYNQLTVFAPEIKGLWGMLPIPGTQQVNGEINRATPAVMTGSIILAQTKDPDSAFEYLKWWTDAQTQLAYGSNLESVVGAAARYNSANLNAVLSTGWSTETKQMLSEQIAELSPIPQVPGGYLTTRYYDFAFRYIVYDGDRVRDSMIEAAEKIDAEILHKREEYGLD